MTSEGLLLETAAICTISGPMLPPLLVKVPITSPIFLLPSSSVWLLPLAIQLCLLPAFPVSLLPLVTGTVRAALACSIAGQQQDHGLACVNCVVASMPLSIAQN